MTAEVGERTVDAEFLICLLARMIGSARSVAVGMSSPIPGSAALLARECSGGATTVMMLGSSRYGPFNDGGPELFDRAAQGRIELFFLGGGQIDGEGNINLVGAGGYPRSSPRLAGNFGSSYLYYLVPRVILFREEHSRRVLVPQVDFVSAPGNGPAGVFRCGGPEALVTGRAVFEFDRDAGRFRLRSIHPGQTMADIHENTGFEFDCPPEVPTTDAPDEASLSVLRRSVRDRIAEVYPVFAEKRLHLTV